MPTVLSASCVQQNSLAERMSICKQQLVDAEIKRRQARLFDQPVSRAEPRRQPAPSTLPASITSIKLNSLYFGVVYQS
jgi:hypothetical protein